MTPKTLLSIEEFAALPDDGMKHELNEGELITMPPPKPRHGNCQARLAAANISFVRRSRLQNPDEYFQGGPDLAVEIVSPGDDASDLREKIKQYLDAGTSVVWVVYPRSRQIEIHTPDKIGRTLGVEDTLDAPELLPGFKLSVRAILE